MKKWEFYRAIEGAEYFAVEADTEDQALAILEDAENPDEYKTDMIYEPDRNWGTFESNSRPAPLTGFGGF